MTSRNKKGLRIPDSFLDYIKGYSRLDEVARNPITGVNSEIESIRHSLFPEQECFSINHSNLIIKSNLEKYFLDKYYRLNRGLYGDGHNLGRFFEIACYGLLKDGKIFYKIDWEEVEVDGNKYTLPVNFRYLRTSAMKTCSQKESIKSYEQKYSLISYIFDLDFKKYDGTKLPRKFKFDKNEILFLKYPFDDKSPTKKAIKYLPIIKKFRKFIINQARSSVEVNNHILSLEKARYTTYKIEKRRYDLTKCKIKTIFNHLFDVDKDLRITEYYDVYTVVRYKKHLNNLREFFVKEFNNQVMQSIAKKNNLTETPVLKVEGFLTNTEIDKVFQEFTERKIALDDFIEKIVKKD